MLQLIAGEPEGWQLPVPHCSRLAGLLQPAIVTGDPELVKVKKAIASIPARMMPRGSRLLLSCEFSAKRVTSNIVE
jgi:hypothetical protein